VTGDPYAGVTGDHIFNAAAFGLPTTGADVFDNPAVAKRNFYLGLALGVSTWVSRNSSH
jgi:hypothetical protein